MKVGITGHTQGVGKEIFDYFLSKNYSCKGFSRKTGYNIGIKEDRDRIVDEIRDYDVFVNNACVFKDDSQLDLLKDVYALWKKQSKIIVNISSRAGDFANGVYPYYNPKYADLKGRQDLFSNITNGWPWVINLKPGRLDTPLTAKKSGPKLKTSSVSKVLEFILENREDFRVRTITFVP